MKPSMGAILLLAALVAGAWYLNPNRPGSPNFIGPTQ